MNQIFQIHVDYFYLVCAIPTLSSVGTLGFFLFQNFKCQQSVNANTLPIKYKELK